MRVNRIFFDRSRHTEWKEQQASYQVLIETDLFNPPSPPSGYDSDECDPYVESVATRKYTPPIITDGSQPQEVAGVPIPSFKLASPYVPYDLLISRNFHKQYEAGLIRVEGHAHDHHEHEESPIKEELDTTVAITDRKRPLWQRIADLFSPLEWCEEETLFFEELVSVFGTNFSDIARIMCGCKTLGQFHLYCRNKWGFESTLLDHPDQHRRETCHLCFISTRGASRPRSSSGNRRSSSSRSTNTAPQMIVCGACERGYHLTCIHPPVENPPSPWYCSDDCVAMSQLVCQTWLADVLLTFFV